MEKTKNKLKQAILVGLGDQANIIKKILKRDKSGELEREELKKLFEGENIEEVIDFELKEIESTAFSSDDWENTFGDIDLAGDASTIKPVAINGGDVVDEIDILESFISTEVFKEYWTSRGCKVKSVYSGGDFFSIAYNGTLSNEDLQAMFDAQPS